MIIQPEPIDRGTPLTRLDFPAGEACCQGGVIATGDDAEGGCQNVFPVIGVDSALAKGHPVMVFLYEAGDEASERFLQKYFEDVPQIAEIGMKFARIKVDVTDRERDWLKKFDVRRAPALIIIDPEGKIRYKTTSIRSSTQAVVMGMERVLRIAERLEND